MADPKIHTHIATLIANARQKKGFATIKELYRARKIKVDYQTWLHAEAGRRIPHPNSLKEIANILDVSREDIILAYCRDKFDDKDSLDVIDTFIYRQMVDTDTLLEAINHDQTYDYTFTSEQIQEMRKDIRLRLYMNYTYDSDFTTTVARLANFFKSDEKQVLKVIQKLEKLGLVEVVGENIKRIYRHTTIPKSDDVFDLRRSILIKSIELGLKPTSHISNQHAFLTQESIEKIKRYLYYLEANFIKLEKEDLNAKNKSRVQLAIVASKINEGLEGDQEPKIPNSKN